ncbi:hypothetical protein [Actinoplanes auranticolor]|nr:hypothetical protein [Actinoplanes auranticolor]
MAGFVIGLLYQVGTFFAPHTDDRIALAVVIAAALIAVVFDVRAIKTDSFAPGLHRQTSKELAHRANIPEWVAPMMWGLDTGLMWTTFRVSATTWVLMAAALLNVAPQWSGLIFGTAFAAPLAVAVLVGRGNVSELGRPGPRRAVQMATVAAALLPALLLVGGLVL